MIGKVVRNGLLATAAFIALLLASSGPAAAKIQLFGDDPTGWEVSFDGSVNAFYVFSDNDAAPADVGAGRAAGLIGPSDGTSSRIRTGLLPAVFGINVKSPEINGNTVGARLGLYPQIQNPNTKTAFFGPDGTAGGRQAGAQIDLREIFGTFEGDWGQILGGRTLGIFQGKNILKDATLFGVGGVGGQASGGTTLGRIGLGYVYPDFNARIQYTTPSFNGFKATVAAFDPSVIRGRTASGGSLTGQIVARETDIPRVEGEVSWAGKRGDVGIEIFVNAMWQQAEFDADAGDAAPNGALAGVPGFKANLDGTDVTSWGIGPGIQLILPVGPGSFEVVGSAYVGEGLGSTFQLDQDALDAVGDERDHWGFYAQGKYSFGQGTSIAGSYGGNFSDETSFDERARVAGIIAVDTIGVEEQRLADVMIFHDVNKNFRIIAEYARQTTEWFDGRDQDQDIVAVGTFFFW